MTAEVTVVIPTHNRRVLLARTLHSVLAQRHVDLAVVVVDDGGSDGTADQLARIEDPRLEVVRHPTPRGVSAARNTGIARAVSPWLAFVDDDDLWAPSKLRAQLDALAAQPEARWACTGSVNIDDRGRLGLFAEPPAASDVGDELLRRNVVPGGGSGVLAARDLTVDVGGFDEAISNLADWDFYIRLGLRAPVASARHPHLGYFVHPRGMAHDVGTSQREYRYLDVKYGRERRRRGVELDDRNWTGYLASMATRGGQRRAALGLHVELITRHRRWRSVRSVGLALAPRPLREGRARQIADRPADHTAAPPGWLEEATAWLAPYEHGWLD